MKRLVTIVSLVLSTAIVLTACGGGGGGGTNPNPTYTVTYNGNGNTGGSVPIDSTNYEQGQTVTMLGNIGNLVKTGYSFAGWNEQANGFGETYTQGQTCTMGAVNLTLYANWTANATYTVTYNGNGNIGGSVPIDITSYEQGQTVTVLANTGNLVKAGYSFAGWNTQADGSGTTYTQAQTFTIGAANVTLYAKWTTNLTYTVTYIGNGNTSGSVPIDSTNYEQGQAVTVLANTGNLAKAGYSFTGWNTQADGSGATYPQAQTFTMGAANVTLYAIWTTSPTYTVTYNGNGNTGGSVPVDSTNYTVGQTVTVLGNTGNLVKTGYSFVGWNTQADGSGTTYPQAQTFTMGAANVTLYVMWTSNLSAPTGVTATTGNQQNTIAWLPVSGATSYNIYWSTASGVNKQNGSKILSAANPYTHPGLTNWITCYYVVTAVNVLGEGAESQEVHATPQGAPGTLDTTFNNTGYVVQSGGNHENKITTDSNGNIFVVGSRTNAAGNLDMVIWRYNANGNLDTTFNGQGYVVTNGAGQAITIDSSGRILVTGSNTCRYNANGTLDTTFNGQGYVDEGGNAITIDSSGRILVTGSSANASGNSDMAIWRYNVNGTLDTTFNNTGFVVSNGAAGGTSDTASDFGSGITIDSSGRILVTGYSANTAGNYVMVIWRYNTNGTLDTTFNGQGYVVSSGTGGSYNYASGSGITIDSSGRILVTGEIFGNTFQQMTIWRYTANGTLDTTFNGQGYVVSSGTGGAYIYSWGSGITIDSSGRILVTGNSNVGSGGQVMHMVIWRYTANGTLDTTFNNTGYVSDAGAYNAEYGSGIIIDSSGRILVTGVSNNSHVFFYMVIWRYNP